MTELLDEQYQQAYQTVVDYTQKNKNSGGHLSYYCFAFEMLMLNVEQLNNKVEGQICLYEQSKLKTLDLANLLKNNFLDNSSKLAGDTVLLSFNVLDELNLKISQQPHHYEEVCDSIKFWLNIQPKNDINIIQKNVLEIFLHVVEKLDNKATYKINIKKPKI